MVDILPVAVQYAAYCVVKGLLLLCCLRLIAIQYVAFCMRKVVFLHLERCTHVGLYRI